MPNRWQGSTRTARKIADTLTRTAPPAQRFRMFKERSHDGKRKYTEAEAKNVAARMNVQLAPDKFAAYECKVNGCGGWHIGNDKNADKDEE